jgi:hypothetical protein
MELREQQLTNGSVFVQEIDDAEGGARPYLFRVEEFEEKMGGTVVVDLVTRQQQILEKPWEDPYFSVTVEEAKLLVRLIHYGAKDLIDGAFDRILEETPV